MAVRDTTLYIGTVAGLFKAELGSGEPRVRPLGLQNRGGLRWPIVIDQRDPRRLYAGTSKGGIFRSEDGGQSWREANEGIVY